MLELQVNIGSFHKCLCCKESAGVDQSAQVNPSLDADRLQSRGSLLSAFYLLSDTTQMARL
eukprot:4333733-Amphidinium_carterae.1